MNLELCMRHADGIALTPGLRRIFLNSSQGSLRNECLACCQSAAYGGRFDCARDVCADVVINRSAFGKLSEKDIDISDDPASCP